MSTENDVPLGEGSRRYYEQKFGDRIRQVNKGGSVPKRDSGGSNGTGRAGCGVAIAILVVIRLVSAVFNSHSHTSSRHFTPPPPPPRFNGDPFAGNRGPEDEVMQPLRDLLERRPFPGQPNNQVPDANLNALLTKDDVPLLKGLCYRLHQESLRAEATPGKHFLALLDPDVRSLIVKAARGQNLDEDEREEVLDGLNEILQDDAFWNLDAFGKLRLQPEFHRIRDQAHLLNAPPNAWLEGRRLILQLCYPRQIVPLSERNKLDARGREAWRRQAQLDLDAAHREYEGAKR